MEFAFRRKKKKGISNVHLSFESISSSGLASFHFMSLGARMDCTMNLCLLFSLGSYSNGCSITVKGKEGED
uniref:Uncharacterized protein n=1 Tax=Cyprinodon variegatus TaxID=28743 RepID=A0A3Q2G900_CYPVA